MTSSETMRWSWIVLIALTLVTGCYTTRRGAHSAPLSRLKIEVSPREAHLYIDEEYQGRVDRWRAQTIPIQPGQRRVELQAKGYLTQRFDIEIAPREELTLTVALEPEFERVEPLPESSRKAHE